MFRRILIIAGSFIMALFFCGAFAFANASQTTLTANVPETCTLRFELKGNGQIEVNGTKYSESTEVQVGRHSNVTISVLPDKNCEIMELICNGENCLSEMRENTLTLTDINEDFTIKVSFNKIEGQTLTGDSALSLGIYLTALIASAFIIFLLWKRQGKLHQH